MAISVEQLNGFTRFVITASEQCRGDGDRTGFGNGCMWGFSFFFFVQLHTFVSMAVQLLVTFEEA